MAVELELYNGDGSDTRPAGDPMQEYNNSLVEDVEVEIPLDMLAAHINRQWEINKRDKLYIEQEMLAAQEVINNEYDSATMAEIKRTGGSEVFIPLTSMQCNAGASWMSSVLMPPGDRAFSIKPTPIPELPPGLLGKIEQDVKQRLQQNAPRAEGTQIPTGPDGQPLTPKDVKDISDIETKKVMDGIRKESAKRAERMEDKIADQLESSGWFDTLEDFLVDLATFPTAFIKTVYADKTSMVTMVNEETGQISMEKNVVLQAKDERVSPFDLYPSPDQTCINDGSMIERMKLNKKKIYDCIGKPGYSTENILTVLENAGSVGADLWQSNVDSQRRYSENHSTGFNEIDDGTIYALRFCGPVSVETLLDWGYSEKSLKEYGFITEKKEDGSTAPLDLHRQIEIDAILVGNNVIKATPNVDPEGKRAYYSASYRRVPGSFWGKSIAMLSKAHQRLVNATARALSNNMGIASGPQIVLFVDRLPDGEDIQALEPLHIWQMTSDPQGSNAKPMEFFQPKSNAEELLGVYRYFFDSVGEVTGIPRTAYSGDPTRAMPGANTASGLAMILETASKQIKQAVRNVDVNMVEKRIKYQYRTNMMDTEVPNSFKGDMQISAMGARSTVAKAVENQRGVELLQATSNPMDSELLGKKGRAVIYRMIARNYDLPGLVPTEEEMEELEKKQQQEKPKPTPEETQLQIEQIRADVRLKDQELENQNAEAQRQLDLKVAKMEFEAKRMEHEYNMLIHDMSSKEKTKQTALKEKNANARFQSEIAVKKQTGEGI